MYSGSCPYLSILRWPPRDHFQHHIGQGDSNPHARLPATRDPWVPAPLARIPVRWGSSAPGQHPLQLDHDRQHSAVAGRTNRTGPHFRLRDPTQVPRRTTPTLLLLALPLALRHLTLRLHKDTNYASKNPSNPRNPEYLCRNDCILQILCNQPRTRVNKNCVSAGARASPALFVPFQIPESRPVQSCTIER